MKCKKSVYSKLAFNAEDNSGILQVVAQMKSSEEPILEVSAGKMKISCGKLFKIVVYPDKIMVDPSSLKQSFQADAKILTCSLSIDKGLMEKEAQRQQHLKSKKRKLDAAEEKSMQLELIQKLAGNEEATRKKKLDLESQKLQKIQEKQNKKTEKKQKIQAMKRQALNQLLQKESVSTKDSKSIPPKSEKRRVRFADE